MQFTQREAQHVALAADRREARRARRRLNGNLAQRNAERIRIVGLDRCNPRARKTKPREDRLRQRDGLVQSGNVVPRLGAQQKPQRACAISKRRRDHLQPDLRHLVDRKRQHVRRQTVAMPRQRVDQLAAMILVVQQHDRIGAAGFAIS